jgi:hypothetical protein
MWLSITFNLPAIADPPRIEFSSPTQIAAVRYQAFLQGRPPADDRAVPPAQGDIVAVYEDTTKTIHLLDGWTGSTPAELSVLVHEMVHHLQNLAGLRYECPAARERLAFEAQSKWLGLFGRDLAGEFEIDPFTLLVKTRCLD